MEMLPPEGQLSKSSLYCKTGHFCVQENLATLIKISCLQILLAGSDIYKIADFVSVCRTSLIRYKSISHSMLKVEVVAFYPPTLTYDL